MDISSFYTYQNKALESLKTTKGRYKAFVMPTGSGKTRVSLAYLAGKLEDGDSVAYIVESDAHVDQVLREAERIKVPAVWIPGGRSRKMSKEQRKENLGQYEFAQAIGVFAYAGYTWGSDVVPARVVVMDDAHAVMGAEFTLSSIEISRDVFPKTYEKVLEILAKSNSVLAPNLARLDRPVHRGGPVVWVPPIRDKATRDAVLALIQTTAQTGDGFDNYRLGRRLAISSDRFHLWPMVVTRDSICWRPFILPHASYGRAPTSDRSELELVLSTATRGPEGFLQERLGIVDKIVDVPIPEKVPEMGTRLVLSYDELRFQAPPSPLQAEIVTTWTRRFGSTLVTVTADDGETRLRKMLPEDFAVVRYSDPDSVERFKETKKPKVLVLVNRASGIDVPSAVCNVALHLDLPHSTSGHEVVMGDVERGGTTAEASLGIRLSQLLGRINRSPKDRTVHLILNGPIPWARGSTFCQAMDPAALLDLLIGTRRGIGKKYPFPTTEGLIEEVDRFLRGDNAIRDAHVQEIQKVRDSWRSADAAPFRIAPSTNVEMNLQLARGNFEAAADKLRRFAQDAEHGEAPGYAAFFELQWANLAPAFQGREASIYGPGGPSSVLEGALKRGPGSHVLVAALRQALASPTQDVSEVRQELLGLQHRRQGLHYYGRWITNMGNAAPAEGQRAKLEEWTKFWRQRLTEPDHDTLTQNWIEAFQLLGANTPRRGGHKNDALIDWAEVEGTAVLGLEVKGRKAPDGGETSEIKPADVVQAATNAVEARATRAGLVTSRTGRDRDVPGTARDRGVSVVLQDASIAIADVLSAQCVGLENCTNLQTNVQEIPYEVRTLVKAAFEEAGVIEPAAIKALLPH